MAGAARPSDQGEIPADHGAVRRRKAGRSDFAVRAGEMMLDYSKTNIDATGMGLLLELAEVSGVAAKREAMFGGAKINDTEGRAVLHTALRAPVGVQVMVDGADVMPAVHATRARMAAFVR